MFPDIIDKAILFSGIGSGRHYFHSLLFVFLTFCILYLFTKGNKEVSVPFLIGMLFHILLDLPDVPIFYPFIKYGAKKFPPLLSGDGIGKRLSIGVKFNTWDVLMMVYPLIA